MTKITRRSVIVAVLLVRPSGVFGRSVVSRV